jgi:hypothetical protein
MRLSGTRPIIFGFILAIGITLTLPYIAFAGHRSFGWLDPMVIFIQQFQPAAAAQPSEPAENRIYVQPRWVDGGYGVQVLQPGYWTDPKQAEKR